MFGKALIELLLGLEVVGVVWLDVVENDGVGVVVEEIVKKFVGFGEKVRAITETIIVVPAGDGGADYH